MYSVKVENKGDSKYYVSSREHKFTIDSEGSSTAPLEALLAGLGACVGVYVRYYAAKNPLPFKEFTVNVEAELLKEKPVRFEKLNVTIIPKGASVDEPTKAKLVEFVKSCPAHNTFKLNPEINIKIYENINL